MKLLLKYVLPTTLGSVCFFLFTIVEEYLSDGA